MNSQCELPVMESIMKHVWLSSAAGFLAVALATTPAVTMSAQSGGGTIEGHVRLTGTPPPNAPIGMGADPNCLKINAGKRVVQERALKAADGGLANAFVDVNGSFPQSPVPSTSVVIDQQGCLYHPRIQGARVGQTLEVKNSDQRLHNIHSLTTKNNAFNTGQPQAGMVFKFPLKTEEVMLRVKCDVHPWMAGYIGVVTHPYFAVTDATGAFTLANVPAGKQTVQVWHELYGALTQTIDVKSGATTTVDFSYTGNEKPSTTGAFVVQDLVIPKDVTAVQLVAATPMAKPAGLRSPW
jgi:plastocyanin